MTHLQNYAAMHIDTNWPYITILLPNAGRGDGRARESRRVFGFHFQTFVQEIRSR